MKQVTKEMTLNAYKFNELSNKAKRAALHNHRFINIENPEWLDSTVHIQNYYDEYICGRRRGLLMDDSLLDFLEKHLRAYTDYLKSEQKYMMSDEAVSDALINLEMEFNKDGSDFE